MTKEKVKQLCRMCDVKIYRNGDKADVKDGAILIRGGLQVQAGATENGTGAQGKGQTLPNGYPTKLSGAGFMAPQKVDFEITAEAQSADYAVVLHFPAGLRDRIIAASGTVNAAMVTTMHRKKYLKRGTLHDEDNEYLNAA